MPHDIHLPRPWEAWCWVRRCTGFVTCGTTHPPPCGPTHAFRVRREHRPSRRAFCGRLRRALADDLGFPRAALVAWCSCGPAAPVMAVYYLCVHVPRTGARRPPCWRCCPCIRCACRAGACGSSSRTPSSTPVCISATFCKRRKTLIPYNFSPNTPSPNNARLPF